MTGTLSSPIAGGSGTYSADLIGSPKLSLDYMAGGTIINLSDYGYSNLISIYHGERWPTAGGSRFWGSLGMAVSTDTGVTWTDCGEIIYHNQPYDITSPWAQACEIGGGGCIIWPDGYLYVYHMDVQQSGSNVSGPLNVPTSTNYLTVSRCLVSDIITAIGSLSAPTFVKYHSGSFSQNAITSTSHSSRRPFPLP